VIWAAWDVAMPILSNNVVRRMVFISEGQVNMWRELLVGFEKVKGAG